MAPPSTEAVLDNPSAELVLENELFFDDPRRARFATGTPSISIAGTTAARAAQMASPLGIAEGIGSRSRLAVTERGDPTMKLAVSSLLHPGDSTPASGESPQLLRNSEVAESAQHESGELASVSALLMNSSSLERIEDDDAGALGKKPGRTSRSAPNLSSLNQPDPSKRPSSLSDGSSLMLSRFSGTGVA